jgi:predicted choloylglycine hydrolase
VTKTIIFKVTTTAQAYGVKYVPIGNVSNVVLLNFNAENIATAEMEPGQYMLSWVFGGAAGNKFQMAATEAGAVIGIYPVQPDTIPVGAHLGHHVGLLVVS